MASVAAHVIMNDNPGQSTCRGPLTEVSSDGRTAPSVGDRPDGLWAYDWVCGLAIGPQPRHRRYADTINACIDIDAVVGTWDTPKLLLR